MITAWAELVKGWASHADAIAGDQRLAARVAEGTLSAEYLTVACPTTVRASPALRASWLADCSPDEAASVAEVWDPPADAVMGRY